MNAPQKPAQGLRAVDAIEAEIRAAEDLLKQLREELTTAQWLLNYDRTRAPA